MDSKKRKTIKVGDYKNNREVPLAFWQPRFDFRQISMKWSYIEPSSAGCHPGRVLGPFPIKF